MELNSQQTQAAFSQAQQNLILAGAGTGKTRVIIKRIEYLIQNGTLPEKIIVTTFTNKAASEIRTRINQQLNSTTNLQFCGTFHRISALILKNHGHLIGIQDNFKVLTEDEQKRLIRNILKQNFVEEDAKSILEKISLHKENIEKLKEKSIIEIFKLYQNELETNNMLDYSDLINKAIFLFKANPEFTKILADHILIDEYQDINNLQYEWIKLVSHEKNLFCVGDEDQAIYSFRGANIKYIQQFQQDFPNANIIHLNTNYRSCKQILKSATNLIGKNEKKFKKELIAANEELNGFIKVSKLLNEYDEATFCSKLVAQWKQKHPEYTIGILVRTNMQINYIEHALVEAKIPYSIHSGRKFYNKSEIQDMISYLRSIIFPQDFLAFSRIINSPKRSIGESRLTTLLEAMKALKCNFENALISLMDQLPKNAAQQCSLLLMQISKWRNLRKTLKCDELIDMILSDTSYIAATQLTQKQIDNISMLKEQIKESTSLEEFLDKVQLTPDENSQENEVQLMTMHAAKGLEFDIVIAPGWEENIFPSLMIQKKEEIEEERRLAYVTITRARHFLEITYATSRRINGKYKNQLPSRFIFDL